MSTMKVWNIDGVEVQGRTAYEAWINSKIVRHFSAIVIRLVKG